MKYFTKAQIDEIRMALATLSVRDTDFEETAAIDSDDCVAIVQDGTNKKISVDAFRNELQNGPKGDDGKPGRGIVSVVSEETETHDTNVIFNFTDDTSSLVTIPQGVSIASSSYMPSSIDGGTNVLTLVLTDGSSVSIDIKNGNRGNSGYTGAAEELEVVNNLVEGGDASALSAEMGRELSLRTMRFTPLPVSSKVTGSYFKSDGSVATISGAEIWKYQVTEGNGYLFSGHQPTGWGMRFLGWYDDNGTPVKIESYYSTSGTDTEYTDQPVVAPEGATYAWMNVINSVSSEFAFKTATPIDLPVMESDVDSLKVTSEKNTLDIANILANISSLEKLTPDTVHSGKRFNNAGELVDFSSMSVYVYEIESVTNYYVSAIYPATFNVRSIAYYDENGTFISYDTYHGGSEEVSLANEPLTLPEGAVYIYLNVVNSQASNSYVSKLGYTIPSSETSEEVSELLEASKNKLIKAVVNSLEGGSETIPFYIRASYNSTKDIIITHRINANTGLAFKEAYIGAKNLTDDAMMTSTYLVSTHTDSTAPLYNVTQYWHLFAQHGYPIPYISNNVGMTATNIGSEWEDQLSRRYTVGKVTTQYIWLLPKIYQNDQGHYVRDWHNRYNSAAITTLTYASGGSSGAYTGSISVSAVNQEQLRPIMEHSNRIWYADGVQITEPGIYYCDNFRVNETEIGYDPATVNTWFGDDDKPVLSDAEVMAIFTFSYNYCGAQCCVNTTIDIRREVECRGYGATQQQFFFNKGSYDAMFMIPKAADRNGVVISQPFQSGSTAAPSYRIHRNSTELLDVNNPVDRCIGYLYDDTNDDYLVGMAAGLSLVSGDTVTSKRISNCLIGNNDRNSLCLFSPENTNKFYVMAINSSPFAANDYYFPDTYFKEINYYVSYFDPAENVGQVYWYKDGSRFVIYCHCQSMQAKLAINVPSIMEGLSLSVVEKTNDAELITDTIQNGKFFVNYNSAGGNYIVLVAK